jgi:streptogramin lyase
MRRLRAVAALGLVLDVAGVSGRTDASLSGADSITTFEPRAERFRVFRLPRPDIGVRAMAIDGGGRLWHGGSQRGTPGEIE